MTFKGTKKINPAELSCVLAFEWRRTGRDGSEADAFVLICFGKFLVDVVF